MHDIILMLTGAGAMLVGFVGGRMHRPKPKPQAPVTKCRSCGHGIGMHKDMKGQCQVDWFDSYRAKRICACSHYDGPQPLPEFFAQEISS